jgi:SHS2 domain-containing protein
VKPYRLLEHTADIRVRIYGRSLKGLFQNAVCALTDTLTDFQKVKKKISRQIAITADNQELLLVQLLQELLFLFDARRFVARRLEFIRFDDKMIKALVWGEKFSPDRHPPKTEIKAVTYHQLKVEKRREGWVAEVVFDV